jgi:hypothetical protein
MQTKIYDLYFSDSESTYTFIERDNASIRIDFLPVGSRLIRSVSAKSLQPKDIEEGIPEMAKELLSRL